MLAATVSPSGGKDGPPEHLFDWGRQVAGYLTIEVPPAPDLRAGLLYTGDAPPDPHRDRPAASILAMPGQRVWRAARPGRFRYAHVVGIANSGFIAEGNGTVPAPNTKAPLGARYIIR